MRGFSVSGGEQDDAGPESMGVIKTIRVCSAAVSPRWSENLIPLYSTSRNAWRVGDF